MAVWSGDLMRSCLKIRKAKSCTQISVEVIIYIGMASTRLRISLAPISNGHEYGSMKYSESQKYDNHLLFISIIILNLLLIYDNGIFLK